ncbi:MAG: UDP-N-acetylglucosamine--N-acetylmuramyl-(pentapeptide) pyrophosphoryl-undecaprenol N-acetylglucosamine transferase [Chitinophagaceae bacterium]
MHKVIIAGGGTGGHIFPAIAIAGALKRVEPDIQILFVGAKGRMEMEKVPQAGYPIEGLNINGFNRNHLLKNFSLPFQLMKSWIQANRILNRFQPHAVVGVGGYASFPLLFAAQRKGIPTLIQEQNSFAGKANRFLGKKAKKICVSYPEMGRFFPATQMIVTGNPVRDLLVHSTIPREKALDYFGLGHSKKNNFNPGRQPGSQVHQ